MTTDKVNINFNLRYPYTEKGLKDVKRRAKELKLSVEETVQKLEEYKARKHRESPIMVVVRWKGKKFKAGIGQSILPAYWNDKKQTPRADYRGADTIEKRKMRDQATQELKDLLEVVKRNIESIFNSYRTVGKELPSLNQFTQDFNGKSVYAKQDFYTFARDLANNKKYKRTKAEKPQSISPSTMRAYQGTINLVREFCKYSGRKSLEFQDVNKQFYDEFKEWMENKAVPQKRSKIINDQSRAMAVGGVELTGYSANFIGRTIRILKSIMNLAYIQKLHTSTDFKDFEAPMTKGQNHPYVNLQELKSMMALEFTPEEQSMEQVRDLFVLGSFTGLRISDLSNFNENAVINSDRTISVKTQKTRKWVHLPLPGLVEAILDKYNRELPNISPQRFNVIIKEVAKRVPGLDKPHMEDIVRGGNTISFRFKRWERLASHSMRRSFATNMVTEYNLSPHVVMLITGHADYETFKEYVKLDELQAAARIAQRIDESMKTA